MVTTNQDQNQGRDKEVIHHKLMSLQDKNYMKQNLKNI